MKSVIVNFVMKYCVFETLARNAFFSENVIEE